MLGHLLQYSICASTMLRAQNRTAKGSTLMEDKTLFIYDTSKRLTQCPPLYPYHALPPSHFIKLDILTSLNGNTEFFIGL